MCLVLSRILAAPSGSPTNVRISETSKNSLTFVWEPVTCLDRGGVNRYNYEIRNADGIFNSDTSELNVTKEGLLPCTNYNFKARAYNQAGFGNFSLPIEATTDYAGKFDFRPTPYHV